MHEAGKAGRQEVLGGLAVFFPVFFSVAAKNFFAGFYFSGGCEAGLVVVVEIDFCVVFE